MTAEPAFYDEIRASEAIWARYVPLWKKTIALLPRGHVVELGCGPGRFAALLRGWSYLGLDFAPGLIAEARARVPEARFEVFDLRTDPIPDADVYVCLEVLEHLTDDLAVLGRLPKGSLVVLSVPSFASRSHVRTFPTRGSAVNRYGQMLAIDTAIYVPLRRGFFHLIRGRVR